ncbi:hypothetical protein C8Q73DRAFT_688589 [Cubamyces lactineus]|nr:hypothetical protein C8Q73DRAFT_688589 [Cubamyces lactineus]
MAYIQLSFDDLAARCNELMEQQAKLGRELVSLRRAYNATRPINKLPVEILTMIFQLLQVHHGFFSPRWYTVAAVCKHWHELAHDITTLWRHIDFRGLATICNVFVSRPGLRTTALSNCLSKFKNDSLEHIRGRVIGASNNFDQSSDCCFLPHALRHFERFSTLTEVLEIRDMKMQDSSMSGEDYEEYEAEVKVNACAFEERYSANLKLPFNPAMHPRLRSLSLVTVAFTSNLVPIPTLRELYLSDCVRMPTSMSAFLAFVSGCQALEVLKLRIFRPKDDHLPPAIKGKAPQPIPPLTPTALPATLRRLDIEDIAPWIARMLEAMVLPERINLSVTMIAGRDPFPSNRAWDTPIYTAFPEQGPCRTILRSVDTVRVDVDADALLYRITARCSEEGGSTLNITADIPDARQGEYLPDFLTEITKLFHEAPLTDLTIAAVGELHEAFREECWARTMKSFPRLKRLAVSMSVTAKSDFPHPLVPMFKVLGDPDDDGTDLCPDLNVLVLHPPIAKHEAGVMASAVDCLRNRATRGRVLSQIDILLDCGSFKKPDGTLAVKEQSRLERYKNAFQPYVKMVGCGDASYFARAAAK